MTLFTFKVATLAFPLLSISRSSFFFVAGCDKIYAILKTSYATNAGIIWNQMSTSIGKKLQKLRETISTVPTNTYGALLESNITTASPA